MFDNPLELIDRFKPEADNDEREAIRVANTVDAAEGRKPTARTVGRIDQNAIVRDVKRFQAKHGLKVDGIVRPKGPTALRAAAQIRARKPSPDFERIIGRGANMPLYGSVGAGQTNLDADIHSLQAGLFLINPGARPGGTGKKMPTPRPGRAIFPDLTPQIKALQQQHGLKVDGIVEPFGPTHDTMDSLLAPRLEKLVGDDIDNPLPFNAVEPRMVARTLAFRPSTIRTRWQESDSMDSAEDHAAALTLRDATRGEMAMVRDYEAAQGIQAQNLSSSEGGSGQTSANSGDSAVSGGEGGDSSMGDQASESDSGPTTNAPNAVPDTPTQEDIEADRPIHVPPIPTYHNAKKGVDEPRVTQDVWNKFHATMEQQGLSQIEKEVFGKIYSAEGGTKPDGSTVAGVTADVIRRLAVSKEFKKDLESLGVDENTPPKTLTDSQRIKIYRIYMNEVVGPVKASKVPGQPVAKEGIDYMAQKIASPEVVAAVADTLFRMGLPKGAETIQQAINDTYRQKGNAKREGVDGKFGSGTIGSLSDLSQSPDQQKHLIANMMDRRNAFYKIEEPKNIAGETARTGSYRID